MNDKHEILSLFPDHINGKLAEHDKLIVDEALRSFRNSKLNMMSMFRYFTCSIRQIFFLPWKPKQIHSH